MVEKEVEGLCVMVLRNVNRNGDYAAVHVFTDGVTLYYSTSPEWLGISWIEGMASSLEEIAEEACRHFNRQGAWRSAKYVWDNETRPPRYRKAIVKLWTAEEEREFWVAYAAAGGVAAEVNRRRGVKLIDDTPMSISELPKREHDVSQKLSELRLASLRAID